MKKLMKSLVFLAVSVIAFSACSDGKTTVTNAEGEVTEVESKELKSLDFQGIQDLLDSKKKELTEDDIDFLLDQMEIVVEKTEGMTKKEYEAYFSALSGDEQGALMVLGFGLAGAEQGGKMTDAQKKRLEELNARTPGKK